MLYFQLILKNELGNWLIVISIDGKYSQCIASKTGV